MAAKNTKSRKGGRVKGQDKVNKPSIIAAIQNSGGVVSAISEKLGISRSTFYRYLEKYPDVVEALEDEKEAMLDMAEGALFNLIENGELGAICFYLKCKGKQRGYVERQEIDANIKHPPKVELVLSNAPETAPETE